MEEQDTDETAPYADRTGPYHAWGKHAHGTGMALQNGSWKADDYSGDIESGLIAVGPRNSAVPPDVAAKFQQTIADLKSGKIKVFTGPVYDNTGKLRIAGGTTWTTADIYTKTNFFVKGVDGKVSQ